MLVLTDPVLKLEQYKDYLGSCTRMTCKFVRHPYFQKEKHELNVGLRFLGHCGTFSKPSPNPPQLFILCVHCSTLRITCVCAAEGAASAGLTCICLYAYSHKNVYCCVYTHVHVCSWVYKYVCAFLYTLERVIAI